MANEIVNDTLKYTLLVILVLLIIVAWGLVCNLRIPRSALTVDPPLASGAVFKRPRCEIKDVWLQQSVLVNGRPGMNVHTRFQYDNLKNVQCYLAAYFFHSNGTPIKDYNGVYRSPDGNVAVGTYLTPPFEPGEYRDVVLPIPYDELNLQPGMHQLLVRTRIFDKNFRMISEFSPTRRFSLSIPPTYPPFRNRDYDRDRFYY